MNTSVEAPPTPFDAKVFVDSLPGRPGVYRMLDGEGEISTLARRAT